MGRVEGKVIDDTVYVAVVLCLQSTKFEEKPGSIAAMRHRNEHPSRQEVRRGPEERSK
jgi:hypothetical protein